MELKQLTKHIYYTTHEERRDRPCLGYIKDSRYPLMLDCGNSPAHMAEYREELKKAGLPFPKFACITHSHWDHTFGMTALDCPVIASEKTNALLKNMSQWGWTEKEMKKRVENGEESAFSDCHIREEYKNLSEIRVKTAEFSFRDKLTLTLDMPVLFFEIPSPHCDDCAVILAEDVLFLGDAYCSVPKGDTWVYDKEKLKEHIAVLEKLSFSLCIKGHHPPQTKEELLLELKQA